MPGQMLGSPVLDRYGHIYVGVSQLPRGYESRGLLVCLDGNSHKIRWEYRAAGAVESTPVIGDDDVIYFGDNAGAIHAVDFLGNGLWTARGRLSGPLGRHDSRARPRGLRPGRRDAGRVALFFRRPGRRPAGRSSAARWGRAGRNRVFASLRDCPFDTL